MNALKRDMNKKANAYVCSYLVNSKNRYSYLLKVILFAFFIFIQQVSGLDDTSKKYDQIMLGDILEKCAAYCRKLEKASLYFVCKEEIRERIFYEQKAYARYRVISTFINENIYIYDYQLIRKGSQTEEQRILIQENGMEKYEKEAKLKTKSFTHKHVIFGPLGVLSRKWQEYYNYQIVKEEALHKEKTIVIEAIPKEDRTVAYLYGKIWIKKSDYSILKIEWNQASISNYEKIEELAKSLKAKPAIKFVSEYGIEKNGIRFPTNYFVEEVYIYNPPRLGRFKKSEVMVSYKDYKFFTVETEVKYHDK